VWAKVIENLSRIGYDSNSLFLHTYDWRLPFALLEKRDHYFSRLKARVELSVRLTGEKAVFVPHSMGCGMFYYFLKWAESSNGGGGGGRWADTHVHAIVNIGPAFLGTPKAVSALLSGEMRDTAQLGLMQAVMDRFFAADSRRALCR
jgi:phospholipid:diacylglycerol acyltransferase